MVKKITPNLARCSLFPFIFPLARAASVVLSAECQRLKLFRCLNFFPLEYLGKILCQTSLITSNSETFLNTHSQPKYQQSVGFEKFMKPQSHLFLMHISQIVFNRTHFLLSSYLITFVTCLMRLNRHIIPTVLMSGTFLGSLFSGKIQIAN